MSIPKPFDAPPQVQGSKRWDAGWRIAIARLPSADRLASQPPFIRRSAFFAVPESLQPLDRLMSTLAQRAADRPTGSYTTKLLDGGPAAIGAKIREEAEEFIEAAGESGEAGREHAICEAGDLLYHALVLLAWRGISLDEVAAELARREGTSGLAEKASRKTN